MRARSLALALLALALLTLVRPALAWLPEEGGEPVRGEGAQTVTVLLRGVAGDHRIEAWLGQDSAIVLQDMGGGMQAASFRAVPARSRRLALFEVSGEARSELFDGLVILAEFQRCGRGRLERQWISPWGANVLLSAVLLEDDSERLSYGPLTIAAGLAVAEGIEAACELHCQLKWPNDVLLDGAKVAGILVEIQTGAAGRRVVVGIGINTNASPPSDEVRTPATDLASHLGRAVERTEVVRAVLRQLDVWVHRVGDGRLAELHDAWLWRCGMINQRITVQCASRRYVGRILDVSPLEGLVLCCDDGRRIHLPAESTTVVR